MSQETLLFRKFRKSNITIIDLRKCCIITRLRSQTSLPQTHASFFEKKTSRSRSIVYWPVRLLGIHSFKLVIIVFILNNIYEYKYDI